ncbi:hypothetical protein ES703_59159 [subsurface metagenome]
MVLSRISEAASRSTSPPTSAVPTMFTIFIFGLLLIMKSAFFSSLTTFLTALMASFSDLAPVQTSFPEVNMRVAVFGCFSLKTRPGNLLGLYSAFLKTFRIAKRSNF